jgi:hypothetical protein
MASSQDSTDVNRFITANRGSNPASGINGVILRVEVRSCSEPTQMKKHEKMRAPRMKKFGFATLLAGGLTAAFLGLAAPADAAPTGPGSAQDTINKLEADGYNVIVNRVGTTPLESSTA